MTIQHRAARLAAVAAALTLTLAACGGSDVAGLPTADDLGVGAEQPTDDGDGPATAADCVAEDPDCQDTIPPAEDDDAPVSSGMCAPEEPDCQDTIAPGEGEGAASGGATASCLPGDPDCTDESYGGQDAARPVPLSGSPSGADRIQEGATSGATGRTITAAHLLDETNLELTVQGGACDLLEDVVVDESPGEVRVLVLTGPDPDVDACTQQVVEWSTEVRLDAPLGDRALLDLAG